MNDTEKNHAPTFCDFLDDGFTESATFEAEAGEHGELSIKFRPAMVEQRSPLIDAADNDEKYTKLAIDALAKLIVEWTLKDRNSVVVKLSRENIARIRSRKLLNKIIDRVCFDVAPETGLKN